MKVLCEWFFNGYNLTKNKNDYSYSCFSVSNFCIQIFVFQIFFLFSICSLAFGQTEIEGDVSGEWDIEGSPYIIVENTTVPIDEQLIVYPGVQIILSNENILTILGEFQALGEEEDSVYFRQPEPEHNSLIFSEESSDESILSHCRADSLRILVESSSPTFTNNLFYFSSINLQNGSSSDIHENTFDSPEGENPTVIFYINGHDFEIDSNDIRRGGIWLSWVGDCFIRNTQLHLSNIRITNAANLTIDNTRCFSLSLGDGRDIFLNSCTVTNLFQVSDIQGIAIESGHYTSFRGDHMREAVIDSAIFDGSINLMAIECSITNSQMRSLRADDWSILSVENCEITSSCDLNAGNDIDIQIRDNFIDLLEVSCPNTIIENNTITRVEIFDDASRSTIIRNNRITKRIYCARGSQPFFYRNDIGSWGNDQPSNLVAISNAGTRPLFVNNTFHEQENSRDGRWMVEMSRRDGEAEFYNNLFLGDSHGSKGIQVFGEDAIESDYNVFWGLDTVAVGFEIGEHSLVEDPQVMNRRTRNVHLLANSPLIDGGTTRWDRRDPDGTRPDIGCYPFDHREDHSPFIIGEFELETGPFNDFNYEASVIEDSDELEIRFENLPEWLELVEERYEIVERIILAGRPPEEGENHYEFIIWAQDDADQIDSLVVNISINPQRLLWGEISGRLTRDDSPYVVVAPLIVPENERLLIEPGTELQFRHYNDIHMDARIEALGSLTAIGTIEDTIIFTSESERGLDESRFAGDWRGIHIMANENQDSTILQYCRIQNARYGVECDAAQNIRISNCFLTNNYHSTIIHTGAQVVVTENYFDCSRLSSYMTGLRIGNINDIHADSSIVAIYNNEFQGPEDDDTLWYNFGMSLQSDSCEVFGNVFKNLQTAVGTGFSGPKIHNNLFLTCLQGIWASNESYPSVYNNDFIGLNAGCFFSQFDDSVGIKLFNNIFFQCDSVAIISRNDPWDERGGFEITNNLLFNNNCNFFAMDIAGNQLPFDRLGEIVDVNDNGDSCDVHFNIFLDPRFVDPDEGDYHLTENSPCIDAGIDVGLPFGGHAPDIGAFEFDPINVVSEQILQPENFTLFQNFPNPFNHQTQIRFSLHRKSDINLYVYDIQGRLQEQLVNNQIEAGEHSVNFNAENLTSGIYIVCLETSNTTSTISMHFIK